MVSKFKSLIVAAGYTLWTRFSSGAKRLRRKSSRMKLREIPQWVRDFTHDFSLEEIKKGAYSEDGWGIGGMFFGKPPLKAVRDSP